jgi:hypothetical protein
VRGKLRPRVQRRTKDYHDCIVTVCRTGRTVEEVMAMTPNQRKAAKEEARRAVEERYYARHAEREAVWRAWAEAPEPKVHGWRNYLESIGRMDLHRAHGLWAPDPDGGTKWGPLIAKEEEYD